MNATTPVFLHGYSGEGKSLEEFASICFPDKAPVCVDLPGFGANKITDTRVENDLRLYIDAVWQAVEVAVPKGRVHLVGHSYGCMLAFALAAQHPEKVISVDLFAPGVHPRPLPLAWLWVTYALSKMPKGLRAMAWLMRRQVFVDLVTHSAESSSWSVERRAQIKEARRKEAAFYTEQMLRLSLHILRTSKLLDTIYCNQPVRVVYATDDPAIAPESIEWLRDRSSNIEVIETYGSHLGIVAEPERLAALLYSTN